MKLATLLVERESVVVVVDDAGERPRYVPLQRVDAGLTGSLKQILGNQSLWDRCREAVLRIGDTTGTVTGRLLAPIPDPGKVICIGLNYRDHAIESGMAIPEEPVCFSKFSSAVIGSETPIEIPRVVQQTDYEAELVVVIGRRGFEIPRERAWEYVAGYCNGNDVSSRDWQIGRPGKQWMLGKTPDTFAPVGPWLVTADEIENPHELDVTLRLNGTVMQQGNTREFLFGIDEVIAYLSQLMTLEPGDLIFTGTPPGVGMGRSPQVWMQPGDEVEVAIQGLGVLKNSVQRRG